MARPISALTRFILSVPRETPVAEVIAAAAKNGLTTGAGNVHLVRGKYELGPDGTVVRRAGPTKRTRASTGARAGRERSGNPVDGKVGADAEVALKAAVVAVVLESGLDRAKTVFEEVVADVRAFCAG